MQLVKEIIKLIIKELQYNQYKRKQKVKGKEEREKTE